MMLSGDWLWSAVQWSMPAWKEATLMVYEGGNNCQQYENEINKSAAVRGREKWRKRVRESKKKKWKQETRLNKTRETKRAGKTRRKKRERVADKLRSEMKGAGLKWSKGRETKLTDEGKSLKKDKKNKNKQSTAKTNQWTFTLTNWQTFEQNPDPDVNIAGHVYCVCVYIWLCL